MQRMILAGAAGAVRGASRALQGGASPKALAMVALPARLAGPGRALPSRNPSLRTGSHAGHRLFATGKAGEGGDGQLSKKDLEGLARAVKDGSVVLEQDLERESKELDEEEQLPNTEGTAVERLVAGLTLARQTMEDGHVAAALNMTEAALRRAYREGSKEDEGLLQVLAEGHLIAGTVRQRMGTWEAALVHLKTAIETCPEAAAANPAYYYGAGASHAVLGHLKDALHMWSVCSATVNESEELHAEHPWLRLVLPVNIGQTLLRMGRPTEALDNLTQAFEEAKTVDEGMMARARPAILYYAALSRSALGQHDEACETWGEWEGTRQTVDEELLEAGWKERWRQHYVRSLVLSSGGKPRGSPEWRALMERGAEQARALTEESGGLGRGWWMRADCLITLGDAKGALECYRKALEAADAPDGGFPDVRFQTGQCLMQLGRFAEAQEMFEGEINVSRTQHSRAHPRASAGLAAALCEQGGAERLERADGVLKEAIDTLKGKTTASELAERADCVAIRSHLLGLRGGGLEEREAMLLDALKMDPGNPRAQALLEQIKAEKGGEGGGGGLEEAKEQK